MRTADQLDRPAGRKPVAGLSDCREARASDCKQSHSIWAKCLNFASPISCCPITTLQDSSVSRAIITNDLVALRRAFSSRSERPSCIRMCYPGVNGNLDGTHGNALHLATLNSSAEVVAELIRQGAIVNALDTNGMSPLHLAAKRGDSPVLEALLSSEQVLTDEAADVHGARRARFLPERCVVAHRQQRGSLRRSRGGHRPAGAGTEWRAGGPSPAA